MNHAYLMPTAARERIKTLGPRASYAVFLVDLDAGRRYELGIVRKVASPEVAQRRGYWRVREMNLQTGRILVEVETIFDRPRIPARVLKRRAAA